MTPSLKLSCKLTKYSYKDRNFNEILYLHSKGDNVLYIKHSERYSYTNK